MTENAPPRPPLSAWRMVTSLGAVSLLADVVADGGKSVFGPLLGSLGASALVIGTSLGAAEALSLVLRLVSGPLADRFGRHWAWTIAGYALTVLCVPLLFLAPMVGTLGLGLAVTLILLERVGKAARSPAKSAILAHAATAVGTGKGFGVHKTLDLVGACLGPLVVAGVIAATGLLWPSFLVLAVPGALTLALLLWLRRRVPDPSVYSADSAAGAEPLTPASASRWWFRSLGSGLPRSFYVLASAFALTTAGLVSYGIISFSLLEQGVLPLVAIPLLFAAAMAASALGALLQGWAYDRLGARTFLVLPLLVALVPGLALSGSAAWAIAGTILWGVVYGLQDSTVKALVADLLPPDRRATGFGVFAAIMGGAALVGGALVGALYDASIVLLASAVAVLQVVAVLLIASQTLRRPPA